MRLPDEEEAIPLMRQAIDAGMIYIDTSRGYGDSEIKVGKSLKDGYREKVILSTKWSPWNVKIEEDDDT
ncbi:MAG: aldo/keto reductase, partial [Spirochaetes bacterium]|nr:aldo/keto reductase [Spirochaetota bacterium]